MNYQKLCSKNCCSNKKDIESEKVGYRTEVHQVKIGRSYGDSDYEDVEKTFPVYNAEQTCIKPVSGREFYIEAILKNG